MSEDLKRALEFENGIRERCSTRLEPFRWGTALFNEHLPLVWDLNYLRADDVHSASADGLTAQADRMLGGAGLAHRQIEISDEREAVRLAPGLAAAGWTASRVEFMVLKRKPEPKSHPSAGQVDWEELRPTVEMQNRRDPVLTGEEVVSQLSVLREIEARATHLRHFGARVDGRIVAYCDLYSDGVTAQVEDVATLEEHRNRGLGRAVVTAAVDTALREGHDLVFLFADEDDWPKALYARMGFDSAGILYTFRKMPGKG